MHLVLFMTRGMSLAAWEKNGSLSRELALYKALGKRGVRTSIISWGDKEDEAIARRYSWLKVYSNIYNLPASKYERLMPLLHALPLVRADIIKCNQTNGGDLALRCARLWQKPFVARCGYAWSFNVGKENPDDLARVLQIERDVFTHADIRVATTQNAAEYLATTHAMSPDSIICLPNYVPDVFFDAPPPEYADRPQKTITQVGRLAPEKNLFALVQACIGLDVVLRLVGEGPEKEALQAHAEQCGVLVDFFDRVAHDELPALLAESTICVLASEYEGHPKALIEYMARGCAVLATDVQGNNTVVEHMKTGLLCKTNAESLHIGLAALLEDASLRERLGKNAREAARQYNLSEIEEREFQLYKGLPRTPLLRSLGSAAGNFARAAKVRFAKILGRSEGEEPLPAPDAFDHIGHPVENASAENFAPAEKELLSENLGRSEGEELIPAPDAFDHIGHPVENASAENLAPAEKELFAESLGRSEGEEPIPATNVFDHINRSVENASPEEGLRILFSLEQAMYPLQEKLAVAYDGGLHTKHRHTRYHDFFIDRIRSGEKVLDIGCGIGFLAYDIALQTQARVTGIDLSEDNIAVARERFAHPSLEYIQGNALTDIEDDAYDTIILSNVLEHLSGRVLFLSCLRERLKPKRFLFSVPLFAHDWRVPLKKELGLDWRLDPTHETEYTYENFACELASAGLAISYKEFRWGEIWCEASDNISYADTLPANPQITVLMATHNDEAYVGEAIASILRQTEQNFIFLIVNDASTDATPEILQTYAQRDARIRIFNNDFRKGLAASLNFGLDHVATPYIARMDADDLALPERFERQLIYMEAHPEIAAAGSRIIFFDGADTSSETQAWHMPTSSTIIRERTLTMGPQISHPAAFLRTEALKAVDGYREFFATTQDYDLWLRLLERYELGNAPETLLLYRSHPNAVSHARVLEQTVNHVLAMAASEFRREGKADPLSGRKVDQDLLFSLLDCSRPSFWAWIRLLARRNIPDKGPLLLQALSLVPHLDDASARDYVLPEDWRNIRLALEAVINSTSSPQDEEIYQQVLNITKKAESC